MPTQLRADRSWGRRGELPVRGELAAFATAGFVFALFAMVVAYQVNVVAPLALVLGAAAVWLAAARPLMGVYVALGLIPLDLLDLPLGSVASLSPTEAMFAIAGVCWMLRRVAAAQLPYTPSPLNRPLLLLLVAVIPGLAIAADPQLVVKTLLMWSIFFLVFQLIIAEATKDDVRNLLILLAVVGGVVGVIAIAGVQSQGLQAFDSASTVTGRAAATFTQPNNLATFLAIVIGCSIPLALRGPRRYRALVAVALAAALVGIALSLSRGGLVAIAGTFVFLLTWRPFRYGAGLALLAIAVLAIVLPNPLGSNQEVDLFTQRVESISHAIDQDPRTVIWQRTPAMIDDHLVLGIGANQFASVGPDYGLVEPTSRQPFDHGHNIGLTIFAELGLLGLAGLIWLAAATVRLAWHTLRSGSDAPLAFGVVAALAAVAIQGVVDYTLRSNVLAAVVLTLLAFLVVLGRSPGGEMQAAGREIPDRGLG